MKNLLIYLTFLTLFACTQDKKISSTARILQIKGRPLHANGLTSDRNPIYQAVIPENWRIDKQSLEQLNFDTKLPLVEIHIVDNQEIIRITVHNFPTESIDERIPPLAQIQRWKEQFTTTDPLSETITPQAFSGFIGYLFEIRGEQKGERISLLAYSLQICREHYRTLSSPYFPLSFEETQQMRSDVTIKAMGKDFMIEKHKQDIIRFARSFELIHDIPDSL